MIRHKLLKSFRSFAVIDLLSSFDAILRYLVAICCAVSAQLKLNSWPNVVFSSPVAYYILWLDHTFESIVQSLLAQPLPLNTIHSNLSKSIRFRLQHNC